MLFTGDLWWSQLKGDDYQRETTSAEIEIKKINIWVMDRILKKSDMPVNITNIMNIMKVAFFIFKKIDTHVHTRVQGAKTFSLPQSGRAKLSRH